MKRIFISSVIGMVVGDALTASALLMARQSWWPILAPDAWVGVTLAFFLGLSLLEIPLMLFALRNFDERWRARLNAAYVATAGLYAAMFAWVTGALEGTLLLNGLTIVRFVSSLIALRPEKFNAA